MKGIELVAVSSSNLRAIGYDKKSRVLRILFNDGDCAYDYLAVPPQLFNQLKKAESKGTFFAQHVLGKFSYTKINLEKERYENQQRSQQAS